MRVLNPDLSQFTNILTGPEPPTWAVVNGTTLAMWGIEPSLAHPLFDRQYELVDVLGNHHGYHRRAQPKDSCDAWPGDDALSLPCALGRPSLSSPQGLGRLDPGQGFSPRPAVSFELTHERTAAVTHPALARAARLAPVVERVHGNNHPEMTRVRQLTEQLMATADPARTAALFAELRAVTDNYEVPGDVCEAFRGDVPVPGGGRRPTGRVRRASESRAG